MNSVAIKQEKVFEEQRKFIAKVYGWMALALLISGISAYLTIRIPFLSNLYPSKSPKKALKTKLINYVLISQRKNTMY